ncbi:MAG: tRNA (guanosine(37)-N1)-methyltransferase TrmD [Caldimicrobium sp.]|nr:tRNA (guanosine(37)-N1)-methyltransferase TrmD [Caldimicrobium sp.]MCX7613186.1 tRNA (guanosine(37)-N1)-methyltransferase TrmD [Caldimicrobium sp.]MDW8182512.1 tRNA (guanosine(37)-N1)-methyltransferase TrmD [Caldimicrobium sp.]
MRFYLLTIFPNYFISPSRVGLLGKALEKGLIQVEILDLRDFSKDKHKTVDDEPYGGGEGMVFKPEPLYRAINFVKEKDPQTKVIYLSPQGKLFDQDQAHRLSQCESLLLICGRYEGIDERIRANFVDEEISIGDYVLFGGEVASLVLIEAISRLIPGVVGRKDSIERESFTSGLLKYPAYTRPKDFLGFRVPEVLISGNHQDIETFRRRESLRLTLERRPELLGKAKLEAKDLAILKNLLLRQRLYLILIHYPVLDKEGKIIASSLTNTDLHDLARLGRTYGLPGIYIVQPLKEQRELAQELIDYWTTGKGSTKNPLRKEAIKLLRVVASLDEALTDIKDKEEQDPLLVGTDASPKREFISPKELRSLLWEKPICLLLGTAWGIENSLLEKCHLFIEPIWGRLDYYNHLSVRSASAILVDRILGDYTFFKREINCKSCTTR